RVILPLCLLGLRRPQQSTNPELLWRTSQRNRHATLTTASPKLSALECDGHARRFLLAGVEALTLIISVHHADHRSLSLYLKTRAGLCQLHYLSAKLPHTQFYFGLLGGRVMFDDTHLGTGADVQHRTV